MHCWKRNYGYWVFLGFLSTVAGHPRVKSSSKWAWLLTASWTSPSNLLHNCTDVVYCCLLLEYFPNFSAYPKAWNVLMDSHSNTSQVEPYWAFQIRLPPACRSIWIACLTIFEYEIINNKGSRCLYDLNLVCNFISLGGHPHPLQVRFLFSPLRGLKEDYLFLNK